MKCLPTNIILILLIMLIISCKKDKNFSVNTLSFSNDTLKFDTVFTTLGSTTKFMTIKNNEHKAIKIEELKLSNTSNYRINVDGDTGTIFKDVIIPANDSIYVFVEVTIDPNSNNLPFVLLDSIQLKMENKQQFVYLQAYGQNAHFFDGDSILVNTTWTNDLPYVILNYLSVDKNSTLNIQSGCKVYFGGNAAMLVEGKLNIQGGNDTSAAVLFKTYRLDKDISGTSYEKYPGEWAGLFFLRGSEGTIEYLNLQNAQYGINVGNILITDNVAENTQKLNDAKLSNGAKLVIKNSKIFNNSFYNIFGFLSKIQAENLLCYGAGTNIIGLYHGGDYSFINCTFFAQSNAYISHSKTPAFYFSNYFMVGNTPIFADSSSLLVRNSIIYGTLNEELFFDDISENMHKLYYTFNHSCIKNQSGNLLTNMNFQNCINADPKFENILKSDFRLQGTSPCINAGNDIDFYPLIDLTGKLRIGKPDIGVFEN